MKEKAVGFQFMRNDLSLNGFFLFFLLGAAQDRFGHDGTVVVRDLPFSIFKYVNERVTSLYFRAVSAHGEFVDADVLAPVLANQWV
jgi:hypothetical protein